MGMRGHPDATFCPEPQSKCIDFGPDTSNVSPNRASNRQPLFKGDVAPQMVALRRRMRNKTCWVEILRRPTKGFPSPYLLTVFAHSVRTSHHRLEDERARSNRSTWKKQLTSHEISVNPVERAG
jgi:hypothetical protein